MIKEIIHGILDLFEDLSLLTREIQENKDFEVEKKEDTSPVTIADYTVQVVVSHFLRNRTPSCPIIAEESLKDLDEFRKQNLIKGIQDWSRKLLPDLSEEDITELLRMSKQSAPVAYWALDPIDGTRGFIRGDQFAIALSYIEKGEPVFSIMACPNLDPGWGRKGAIAWSFKGDRPYLKGLHDSEIVRLPLDVSRSEDDSIRLLVSYESSHLNREALQAFLELFPCKTSLIKMDSQAKYLLLAAGRGDIYLRIPPPDGSYPVEKVWDHAAGARLVEDAGGMVTDLFGKRLDFSTPPELKNNTGIVASKADIHSVILETLKRVLR